MSSDICLVVGVVMARFAIATGKSMYFIATMKDGMFLVECCWESVVTMGKVVRGKQGRICEVWTRRIVSGHKR